ncbi:MAG TPA: YceI family protein [Candidatus Dormibacteraeota bacterium]|jgi:polyisoprenoid-binding protein YceI
MKWAIDANHSSVTFTIRYMMSKVRGQMKVKEGWIEAGNDHTTARVDVTIDAASINTGVEARDNHLRSADGHFDVENHPVATFKSKRVEGKDPSNFKVIGDLTIHGITKEVTLNAQFNGEGKDPWGNRRVAFSAETKLNRKDFGLTWNQALEAGGFLLGDDVKVEIEAQAIPAQNPAEAKEKIAAEAAAESR